MPSSVPPATERSSVFTDPREQARLRQRIELLERQLREHQVQVVSMRAPAPGSRTAQMLRAAPSTVRWGAFLTGLAAVLGATSPTIVAALDVARLRAELAVLKTERTTEAADLQGFRQRTQQWQETEGPKLREALKDIARLQDEIDALERNVAKRRGAR